jgi:amino acid adenylation domain-containing protein
MVDSANLNDFLSHLRRLDVNLTAEHGRLGCSAPQGVLTDDLKEELKARKAEILEFLQEQQQRSICPPLMPAYRDAHLAPSLSQERLWLLQQSDPRMALPNRTFALRLSGVLDRTALERVLKEIIRRHKVLRTIILGVNGTPRAIPQSEFNWDMDVDYLRGIPGAQRERDFLNMISAESTRSFDLTSAPLIRATLVVLAETDHALLISLPQIAADGWSLGIFAREIPEIYDAFSKNRPSPVPELPVQYVDYARWHREYCGNGELQTDRLYWDQKLHSVSVLDLPVVHRRASGSFDRDYCRQILPARMRESVQSFSGGENVTRFITLLAAFQVLLFRYTRQTDIVVWSTVNGRSRPELETLIGDLSNDLPLRTDLSGNPTGRQLVGRIRDTVQEAFAHKNISPEQLAGVLSLPRAMNHAPPQIMFTVRDSETRTFELPELTIDQLDLHNVSSPYDLTVEAIDCDRGLELLWKYDAAMFDVASIKRMQQHYRQLLEGLLGHPEAQISELPFLTHAEQSELSATVGGPHVQYPRHLTLDRWFERQVVRTPGVAAVICGSEELTYEELSRRSNHLANRLRMLGVEPGALVGLCLDRSVEMAVALFGILKAGGAYVPLDPQYPRERIAFMLQDSQAAVLITEEDLLQRLPSRLPAVVCMDHDRDALARENSEPVVSDAVADDLAYVIYTSGSTGKPKGVEVTHRSVLNLLASMQREPGISEGDRLLAVTTLSFDIAGLEFFLPLVSGAHLIIAPSATAADGEALAQLLHTSGATMMQATPATWRLLLESGWRGTPGLRILCGGESFPRELANRLLTTGSDVWNMYGPTETTIWSTLYRVQECDGPVPIGKPIGNTQVHVLDDFGHAVPVGVPGELYIGGEGVARGYLRRPELTVDKFVANPVYPGERLYRTGDLARRMPDGNLEYIGRLDNQVKIRGFRIELSEIESVLEQEPGIRQAVAIIREDTLNDQRLIAYLIPEAQNAPNPKQLRAALLATLPDYMVPTSFVILEAFPLTPNGKVDRRALPRPDGGVITSANFVPPHTELEREVAEICQEVLHIPLVGRHDNFFDLGGHSLLIVQLQSRLRRKFGREISLVELFGSPTVCGIARLLDRNEHENGGAAAEVNPAITPWKCLVPIHTGGTRTPLFFVVGYLGAEETPQILSRLVPHLGPDQPVYGLRPRWIEGMGEEYLSVGEMASECLAEVRAVQPVGPYLLGGYCVAGSVAFEMAQQLVRAGEEVGLLAMIDAARPSPVRSVLLDLCYRLHSSYYLNRAKHIWDVVSEIVFSRHSERKKLVKEVLRRKFGKDAETPVVPTPDPLADFKLNHWRLMHRYRPEPYPGHVTLIVCEKWYRFDKYPGWAGITGSLNLCKLPGDHTAVLTVHSPELVRFLLASVARGSQNARRSRDAREV